MKTKRKNVQDATLKNIRVLKKRVSALEGRLKYIERVVRLMQADLKAAMRNVVMF